jgi:DNA-binding MarR family transcriptional regulator
MNKTVALVNEWGNFAAHHPEGDIEDFCRYYLASQRRKKTKGTLVGGVVPASKDGLLLKIIGRISKLNMIYANMALKGTDLNQIEEFGMLVTIRQEKNPRKTDVIYANLFELSSGTDMLARLKKRGLFKEYEDAEDKRSKRLQLTPKGEKVSEQCSKRIIKNANLLMNELTDEDKELCIQLLKDIEIKFSALWPKHKGKTFDEVYDTVVKKESAVKSKKKSVK